LFLDAYTTRNQIPFILNFVKSGIGFLTLYIAYLELNYIPDDYLPLSPILLNRLQLCLNACISFDTVVIVSSKMAISAL